MQSLHSNVGRDNIQVKYGRSILLDCFGEKSRKGGDGGQARRGIEQRPKGAEKREPC